MPFENLIITGGFECQRCGGRKWKVEDTAIYCICKNENGNPCCWHLGAKSKEKMIRKIKERKNKL